MKLYKYLSPIRSDVLEHGRIRFTQPQALNDPFELKPNITKLAKDEELLDGFDLQFAKVIAEEYEPYRTTTPFHEFLATNIQKRAKFPQFLMEKMPEIKAMLHRVFNRTLGILCLTESPDNLLMWAHYADEHRGYIIEFDSSSDFFDQRDGDDDYRYIQQVKYHSQRPSFILKDVDRCEMFLTKSVEWEYEQEWRMFLPLQQATEKKGNDREEIYLFDFPKRSITSIILGCRASNETKMQLLNTLINDDEYHGISVLEAELDENHYKLNMKTIV